MLLESGSIEILDPVELDSNFPIILTSPLAPKTIFPLANLASPLAKLIIIFGVKAPPTGVYGSKSS